MIHGQLGIAICRQRMRLLDEDAVRAMPGTAGLDAAGIVAIDDTIKYIP